VDALEDRTLPSGSAPVVFMPGDLIHLAGRHANPLAPPSPAGFGYSPTQIRHAYGFDQISFLTSSTDPNYYNEHAGAGQTIAIVDAYDDPGFVSSSNANFSSSDLAQFDQAFGLPDPPSFTKVGQTGSQTSLPGTDPNAMFGTDWESEIALDVEWAHAIAPQANIILVEANSASSSDLYTAVDYAKAHASVVSLSWGGGEYAGETADDLNHFLQSGVTYVVASGDQGAPAGYPSASPNVVSVGGTTLPLDSAGDYPGTTSSGEVGWSGSGGGISQFEALPSWQPSTYSNGTQTATANGRMNPDVAYDADPNTGFPVYDSFNYNNGNDLTLWEQFGGTSDAAPQWSGLFAIVNQGRQAAGEGLLNSSSTSQTLPLIYGLPSSDFHDITQGTSTGSPQYTAGTGYDQVTGRGSPIANHVVADLIGASVAPPPSVSQQASASPNPVAGKTTTLTVAATAPNSDPMTFTWSLVNGPASVSYSVNGTAGASSTTATFSAWGSYTFQVTIKDTTTGETTTSTMQQAVTVQQSPTSIVVSPTSATVPQNGTKQFTATEYDQFGKTMKTQPTFTWSLTDANPVGTINSSSGLYAAQSTAGIDTVQALAGSVSNTASVTVSSTPPPSVTQAASASPNPVTGKTTTLSVTATAPNNDPMTFTWSLFSGPAAVSYSVNGTASASSTIATFGAAGSYTFQVTIKDTTTGFTTTSKMQKAMTVTPMPTSIVVSPGSASVADKGTQQFTATERDQFGKALATQPSFTWSFVNANHLGSINASTGLYTAPSAGTGTDTVKATAGSVSNTATVTVTNGTLQYSSGQVPAPIWSGYETITNVTVPQDVTIADLAVKLNLSYVYDGDLYIYLVSPSGVATDLSYFEGTGANFSNTVFDSRASVPISSGNSPFASTYQPDGNLAAFNGKDAKGTWQLVVQDWGNYNGRINSWSLLIQQSSGSSTGPASAHATQLDPTNGTATALPGIGGESGSTSVATPAADQSATAPGTTPHTGFVGSAMVSSTGTRFVAGSVPTVPGATISPANTVIPWAAASVTSSATFAGAAVPATDRDGGDSPVTDNAALAVETVEQSLSTQKEGATPADLRSEAAMPVGWSESLSEAYFANLDDSAGSAAAVSAILGNADRISPRDMSAALAAVAVVLGGYGPAGLRPGHIVKRSRKPHDR
jgi:subtilisin-like proprotein convertase family protein